MGVNRNQNQDTIFRIKGLKTKWWILYHFRYKIFWVKYLKFGSNMRYPLPRKLRPIINNLSRLKLQTSRSAPRTIPIAQGLTNIFRSINLNNGLTKKAHSNPKWRFFQNHREMSRYSFLRVQDMSWKVSQQVSPIDKLKTKWENR